jgi:hypothetical protein
MTDWLDTPPQRPGKPRPADWLADRLHRLHELAELRENWDSYGAYAPTDAAIKLTEKILTLLAHVNAEAPHIYPIVEGGIQLDWTNAQRAMEVDIGPEATFEGWLYNPASQEEWEF